MFSRKLAVTLAALVGLGVSASAAHAQALTVTSAANAGSGTLRRAINDANANANRSVIEFKLPAAATVITPAFDLPPLTAPVEIDGYSQPGSSPASATTPALPGVVIDAVNTTRALELNTSDSLIQGFAIYDSSGVAAGPDGIQIMGNANRIEGNHIGTDATGATMNMWNLTTGVAIGAGQGNVVGGPLPEDANVIAEIDGDGVAITANSNTVIGNRLGLPYGGGLGNSANGVSVTGSANHIGAMSTGGRNAIADNNDHGVLITGNGNAVEGNYVGLDETGANGAGNVSDGIHVAGNQNLVRGNVAADNDAGVALDGTSNTVMSNTLGTDPKMTTAIGNDDGVLVLGGNANVIGGDEEDERNFIAGNNDSGVEIEAGQNNRVDGNQVGSDGLANDDGVLVESSFNFVTDNVVAGNLDAGVKVDGAAAGPPPLGNVVDGNDVSGNEQGVVVEDSHRNAITDNAISENLDEGVLIEAFQRPNADGNRLTGNTITDNGLSGVRIEDGNDNSVGLPDSEVNTITGNAEDGVNVESGQDNAVVNNSISDNGDLGMDLDVDGPATNDGLLDADAGANGLQNHPTITGRALRFVQLPEFPFIRSMTEVSWRLRTTASTDYRLEFYGADACDGSGRGEATELIATEQATTDATGLAEGSFMLPTATIDPSIAATATVTDPNGFDLDATSELSPCG
jgi:parallel beta-helix repeat protein